MLARDTAAGGRGRLDEKYGERKEGERQVKGRDREKSVGMVEKKRIHPVPTGTVESSRTVGPEVLFNKSRLMRVIDHHAAGESIGNRAVGGGVVH